MKPVLLLVDLQNDFLLAGDLEPHPASIAAAAADLLNTCRTGAVPQSSMFGARSIKPVITACRIGRRMQDLAAAVFTTSPKRIEDFLQRVRAGILKINCSTANAAVDLPIRGLESFRNRPRGAWPRQSRVLHSHAGHILCLMIQLHDGELSLTG